MRSTSDIRERLLARAQHQLTRPAMHSSSGIAVQAMHASLLADLCFIDDRDQEAEGALRELHSFGERGIEGPFKALFGESTSCENEVSSVFAEVFHRLGYFKAAPAGRRSDWNGLVAELRARFETGDQRRSAVESVVGAPDVVIGTVSCYLPPDPSDRWVYFDFAREHVMQYQEGKGRYSDLEWGNDPLLRDIRVPAATFEQGLVLTLYGRVRRWGTGWWIRDEAERDAPDGVAEGSRRIAAADPSQALRQPPAIGYRP